MYSWAAVSSAFTGGSGTSKCQHLYPYGLFSLWYSGLSEVAAAPSSLLKIAELLLYNNYFNSNFFSFGQQGVQLWGKGI